MPGGEDVVDLEADDGEIDDDGDDGAVPSFDTGKVDAEEEAPPAKPAPGTAVAAWLLVSWLFRRGSVRTLWRSSLRELASCLCRDRGGHVSWLCADSQRTAQL